jgi:hypothetical protein
MMRRLLRVIGLAAALALLLGFAGTSLAEVEGPGGLWPDPGVVRMKFAYVPDQLPDAGGDGLGLYVNHDNLQNPPRTLRVYGREDLSAAFPYTLFDGPFNLKSPEAPPKDFVVHNPAFFDHMANALFLEIDADGDAYEKTHLRTWYTPCYYEPLGETSPMVPPEKIACYPAVVNEYTYILLEDQGPGFLNPTHGSAGQTRLVFPMAYETVTPTQNIVNRQVGLEDYDVNPRSPNPSDEIMEVEAIVPVAQNTTQGTIWVKPKSVTGTLEITPTGKLEFFDYEVELVDVSFDLQRVTVAIYYVGRGCNQRYYIGQATLEMPGCPDPGCYNGDTALVPARFGQPEIIVGDRSVVVPQVTPVTHPFWITLESVNLFGAGGFSATITPHRALTAGETFYVDGAEYDVAAIYILDDPDGTGEDEFKYITIRQPLNKDPGGVAPDFCGSDTVDIPILSVAKSMFPEDFDLPVLPPFNMVHDRIDDVHIPDDLQGDPNGVIYPDEQRPDNIGAIDDGPFFGGTDRLHNNYDTLWERVVTNQVALEFSWVDEAIEPRFITNLLEEKFTEPDEQWQWINIETRPYWYTSLNLPEVDEAPGLPPLGYFGDYILVSSLLTEDSTEVWPDMGSVRMKFAYDAGTVATDPQFTLRAENIHDADIYVNDAAYNGRVFGINANSLRVYGRCDRNAAFPYTLFDGPFNLKSPEAPEKDFVVFNPAFIDHYAYGLPGEHIKADGDANEKVHLRMWYTPKYDEPAGDTYPVVDPPVSNWDLYEKGTIPLEYTYIMIQDPFLDPTHGTGGNTQLVFPMAGTGGQPGLDRYDINFDGNDEVMKVEAIVPVAEDTTLGEIWVAPQPTVYGGMNLFPGQSLDFLDYRVELLSINTTLSGASFRVFYNGNRVPGVIDTVSLSIYDDDAALFNRQGFLEKGTESYIESQVQRVTKPFWITLENIGMGNGVKVVPHRVLSAGETFFVDGMEYDVAAIYILDDPDGQGDEFKYLTIRNPLDKCGGPVFVPDISVEKVCVDAFAPLPLLPPFNPVAVARYGLDLVDDTDFGDNVDTPDLQIPDNDGTTPCELIRNRITPYNVPLFVQWITETKEIRFDTNLLEEKFTEPDEAWMWINIETLPWDFTEFVLPNLPNVDCTGPVGIPDGIPDSVGDYILVSSLMTEDSERAVPACCQYNFNGVGGVDTQDVLMIADAWLTANPTYDLDNDGLVELDDIMQVVACWDPTLPCP